MPVLPGVIFADAPACICVLLQPFQTLFLFFLTDVEEKLHNKIAVVCQLALKPLYTVNPLFVPLFFRFPVQASAGYFIHPSGIQKTELTCFRNFHKIPIQKWFPLFFLCGDVHGCHLEKSGVNVPDNLPQDTAFSRCTPAFK